MVSQWRSHTDVYSKETQRICTAVGIQKILIGKQTECKKELYALELYQRHAVGENKKSDRFLSEDPAYQELLCPFYQMVTQEELIWSDTSYPKNPNYPEQLKYKSCKMNMYDPSQKHWLQWTCIWKNCIPLWVRIKNREGSVLSGFYNSSSADRKRNLLGTFWEDGLAWICKECRG